MAHKYWTKQQVMDRFQVKSVATLWRWQRTRGFPLAIRVRGQTRVFYIQAEVRAWERDQQVERQFVKGVSDGPRPHFNLPEKVPAT